MAQAMLSRALDSGLCAASDVAVAEPVARIRDEIAANYGVSVTPDNREAAASGGMAVLAVKPQHIAHVYDDLRGALAPAQPVLSIAAGVPIASIAQGLGGHKPIIRVMPNTPAQIGAGMSVWTATPDVADADLDAAARLLGTLGREWRVPNEDYVDMATAVSGSGPAYVFLFIEALAEAGVAVGMPRDMALTLAVETVAGSGRLAQETGTNPALLREMVTSPGGTTGAGLRALERGAFRAAVGDAVEAALRRARELGGKQ